MEPFPPATWIKLAKIEFLVSNENPYWSLVFGLDFSSGLLTSVCLV